MENIETSPKNPDGAGHVQILFGGELVDFYLPNESLVRIEQELDESVFTVLNALVSRAARTSWIKTVVIEGLVGGGTPVAQANGLFKLQIEDKGDWVNAAVIASIALVNAVSGPVIDDEDTEDELGKLMGLTENDPV